MSHHRQLAIFEVGNQHAAGPVGDAETGLGLFNNDLWSDATGPEHGNFIILHARRRAAEHWAFNVVDADRFRMSNMYWRSM